MNLVSSISFGWQNPIYAGLSGRGADIADGLRPHLPSAVRAMGGKDCPWEAHLVTPSIRHVPPQCYDPKVKYRSRMHFDLADLEALESIRNAAGLLPDLAGNVTETPLPTS